VSSSDYDLSLLGVSIRLAIDQDGAAVRALARNAYQQCVAAEGSEPEPMKADYAYLVSLRNTWLAEHQGEVVGLLVLEPHSNYLLLDNIAVAASWRGKGVGRLLMDWSESQAHSMGLREVRLYTGQAMTQNRYYYAARGYVESRRAFENGHHRVYYTKLISGKRDFHV
jgi:N-acetylglutamate synthase-like GNAT family acetyltransferase